MSDDEQWLQIGKTFVYKEDKIQQEEQSSHKKKKEKKKEKLKETQQIAIRFSEQEIEAYYDQKLENQYKVDTTKQFIYRHEMGTGLLSIQLLPIGDEQILAYGHLESEIPHYNRSNQKIIVGIRSEKRIKEIYDFTINLREQKEIEYPRYTYSQAENLKSYTIKPIAKYQNEDFILFNDQLNELDPISKDLKLQQRNLELQSLLQQNVNDLEVWKEFLQIQEKVAELQGYNEPIILANRKLSILQKLEQASEVLADHPWVLAYKISMMQNLELRNDELHKSIDESWSELFSKYVHIQPIWILFLDNKLKTEKFSATMLRMEAMKHFSNLQQKISETTRVQLIQLFKRIYIEMIQQIAFYEYEMGFRERSIGILQALCEMNIFAPKHLQRTYDFDEKVREFREYWDTNLRTGEQTQFGWMELPKLNEEFIGYLDESVKYIEIEDPIDQFLHFQKIDRWRPANQEYDKTWIEQNVDAAVIYEDIEPYLHIFNDQESKLNLISVLLQQLGFPPIDYNILPVINNLHSADMCYNQINIDYYANDVFIKYSSLFQLDIHANKSKFIYICRLLSKVYELIQNQYLLIYIFILNGILYLNDDQTAVNSTLTTEMKSGLKTMKSILKEQQNNLLLWLLYAEFESMKKGAQPKLISQISLFAKSKKKQLMIIYYQFTKIQNYDESVKLLQKVLDVYSSEGQISEITLILKIRNLFNRATNKWDNLEKLNTYKKELSPFQLSKRAMLYIFMMFLQQNTISENLKLIQKESINIKMLHFNDQQQKKKILTKYKNETSLILLNLLRFSVEKEEICKTALQIDQDQIIFFINYIESLSKKFLYFQKLIEFKNTFQLQSPQICWIAYVLEKDPNKQWFLLKYLKLQQEKYLSQIYCESNDQENFEGMVNVKYNYVLEQMALDLQKKIHPDIKDMYRSLQRNPFSIVKVFLQQSIYTKIIQELKERNESLNLLKDLQEKELKFM